MYFLQKALARRRTATFAGKLAETEPTISEQLMSTLPEIRVEMAEERQEPEILKVVYGSDTDSDLDLVVSGGEEDSDSRRTSTTRMAYKEFLKSQPWSRAWTEKVLSLTFSLLLSSSMVSPLLPFTPPDRTTRSRPLFPTCLLPPRNSF